MIFDSLFGHGDSFERTDECVTINETKIKGFEQIDSIDNTDIAKYINETIPPDHLQACPEIEYNPKSKIFDDPDCLGTFDTLTNSIEIASEGRFDSYGDMLDTLTHEIGHNEHARLEYISPQAFSKWDALYDDSMKNADGFGFVSEYARTDRYEDFAESYKTYIRDPELLKFMSPEKYTFMKYNVFDGREYQVSTLDNKIYLSMDEYMNNVLDKQATVSIDVDNQDLNQAVSFSDNTGEAAPRYRCFQISGTAR